MLIYLPIFLILFDQILCESPPIINTKNGQVQGTIDTTLIDHRKYHGFRGIPYAKAPVGPLRFRPPVKSEPWQGVFNATDYGPPCAQPNLHFSAYLGSEDCLTLNVFSSGE